MAIVTISHQLGAGGQLVADVVARELGYRIVGSDVLAEAAEQHGLVEDRLLRLGDAKPGLLDRLDRETAVYVAVMQSAVLETACGDGAVILGRGGQWLLRDIAHVLRVRIVAPFAIRASRLTQDVAVRTGRAPEGIASRHAIDHLIRHDDADRIGRMRYLYGQNIDEPLLYDAMLSTASGDIESVATAIVQLVRRPSHAVTAESSRRLTDRTLAARVRVALLSDERTRHARHERIEASDGIVRIVSAVPEAAEDVARDVDGVRSVHAEVLEVVWPPPLAY